MPYLGNGLTKFTTADDLTVSGTSELKDNVTVTGDVTASGTLLPTGDTAAGDDAALGFTSAEGLILTGQGSSSDITLKNDADATVFSVPTGQQKILFPDNARALFGDGSDLQIYHDGSDSYINDTGTGNLRLAGASQVDIISSGGEFMGKFIADGASTLYHNNVAKIATTSSGVDVTGTMASDGLTVDGGGSRQYINSGHLRLSDDYNLEWGGGTNLIQGSNSSNHILFKTNSNERMRLDSSGNLLVGKTASNIATEGIELRANDDVMITQSGDVCLYLNRLSSDGSIVDLRKDGSTAGLIGSFDSGVNLYIGSGDTGVTFNPNVNGILPHNPSTNAQLDNAIDLGYSSVRFKNAYFKGTVFAESFTGESDTDTAIQMTGSNLIKFFAGGAEKARISSNATPKFFVGCTENPSSSVAGSMMSTTDAGSFTSFGSGTGAATHGVFGNGNGAVGSIQTSGSSTSYNTSSDRRLKSNIQDAASASDKIDSIQVRQFDWNADGSHQDYGLIAQELEPIEPMAVTGDADSDEMMSVDYSKLVPMLLKEIQELRSRVAALEE